VEALKNNASAPLSDLIIYSEGAKSDHDLPHVLQVRDYIREVIGFRSVQIVERTKNWGCANNIIDGVSTVLNSHGRAIVVEDDISTSPYFLNYMNAALDYYQDKKEILSISGYNHPPSLMKFPAGYKQDVFYCRRNATWGWAIWLDRWENVDWEIRDHDLFIKNHEAQKVFNQSGEDLTDMLAAQLNGKIDSWGIRLTYYHYKHNGFAVWPRYSYTNNIGNDGSGTHCSSTNRYENDLSRAIPAPEFPPDIILDKRILKNYRKVYRRGPLTRLKKLLRFP